MDNFKNLKTFESFDETNEKFDWEDYNDTDLAGPGWEMRCGDVVNEFKALVEKTPMDYNTKMQAMNELMMLFKNQIDDAKRTMKK